MKIRKMADMERLTAVLERYGDAPHVRLKSSYCEGMRVEIGNRIILLAPQSPVDALEMPIRADQGIIWSGTSGPGTHGCTGSQGCTSMRTPCGMICGICARWLTTAISCGF